MAPSTATPRIPLPDADAIIRVCLATVAPQLGDRAVLTSTARYAITAHGIHVRFTTAPARDGALAALRALGYAARPNSRPIHEERGEALLVTGWDNAALASRTDRLERAVAELLAEHNQVAPRALEAYCDSVRYALAHAELHVALSVSAVAKGRTANIAAAAGTHHVTSPVADVDRRTALEPPRGLLARIAAAQNTLAKLTCLYTGTARGVIRLYAEYLDRPGYSERSARNAALHQAAEANTAALQVATSDLEFHGLPDPALAGGTGKAALNAEVTRHLHSAPVPLEERVTIMRYLNRASLDKFDICRRCLIGLRYAGTDAAPWLDAWGEPTCDSGAPHEPFPGAYDPTTNPTD